ncbi:undecaprenyl-diphosphate phosphatase [bacterium]|jgi:undecaprenyl-diphosphatase|nr:undecaprenyl-diphosphate phosphatase [bacterium]
MTNPIKAVLLGILEGLTEFIPVSSTGHLIIAGEWLELLHANQETFDIAIQLGAILAVVILYWDFFRPFLTPKHWVSKESKLVLIAIVPALGLGFLAHSTIKALLFNPVTVAAALIVGGLWMLWIDRRYTPENRTSDIQSMTYKQALLIGLFQCLALWPGFSRSGACMIGGIIGKLDYQNAARFSFIIAVPVMVAAVGYDLLKSWDTLTSNDLTLIAIGFVTAFIVAIFAIKTFIKLLASLRFTPFAIYRILLGALTLLLFL